MKAMNMACRVLTAVFGVGALVLFFLNFVQITAGGELVDLTGSQLAFGGSVATAAGTVKLAKSAHLLFCFLWVGWTSLFLPRMTLLPSSNMAWLWTTLPWSSEYQASGS